jgi:hypothetical protein
MRQAKTAIVLSNRDVRELRQLQRESQRSREKKHPRIMHFWRNFEPHALIDRLVAQLR